MPFPGNMQAPSGKKLDAKGKRRAAGLPNPALRPKNYDGWLMVAKSQARLRTRDRRRAPAVSRLKLCDQAFKPTGG